MVHRAFEELGQEGGIVLSPPQGINEIGVSSYHTARWGWKEASWYHHHAASENDLRYCRVDKLTRETCWCTESELRRRKLKGGREMFSLAREALAIARRSMQPREVDEGRGA